MPTLRVESSLGDALDRCTILTIKTQRLLDEDKQRRACEELKHLKWAWEQAGLPALDSNDEWDALMQVNSALWETEEVLRSLEVRGDFSRLFVQLARSVYKLNDCRARLKRSVNERLESTIVEVKSYGESKDRGVRIAAGSPMTDALHGESATVLDAPIDQLLVPARFNLLQHGYVAIAAHRIWSKVDFIALRAHCERLAERLDDGLEPGVLRLAPFAHEASLRALTTIDFCTELLEKSFAAGPRLDTVMFREPLQGYGQQRLHQDPAFPAVTFLLNLAPMNRWNGATRLIPGSHHTCAVAPSEVGLEAGLVWLEAEVPTLFAIDNRVLHGGTRNRSGAPRPLVYWVYRDTNLPRGGSLLEEIESQTGNLNLTPLEESLARGISWPELTEVRHG